MYLLKTDATLLGSSALAGAEKKVGALRRRQANTATVFFMSKLHPEVSDEDVKNCES
jgi:hypothetical protein